MQPGSRSRRAGAELHRRGRRGPAITAGQWAVGGDGLAVTARMLDVLPAARAELVEGPVTIDLDATNVEVYGRKKRGVAYNHQGQRVSGPHVARVGRDGDRAGR